MLVLAEGEGLKVSCPQGREGRGGGVPVGGVAQRILEEQRSEG